MRAPILLSALLGAGAIAQPHLQHAGNHRHHHKRDEVETYREGNMVVVEHIVDVYVTVEPGQAPAATPAAAFEPERPAVNAVSSAPAAAAVAEKYAVHNAPQQEAHKEYQHPSSAAQVVVAPPSVTPIAAPAQVKTYAAPQPSTVVSAAPESPESTSTTDTSSAPDTYWSNSPLSPITGGSGAIDVLTSANNWRKKWMAASPPTSGDYTWSPIVANNSYYTATDIESRGTNMVHSLLVVVPKPNGVEVSSAQCEASGKGNTQMNTTQPVAGVTLTPFERGWFEWMCERPNDVIVDICAGLGYNTINPSPSGTGHADIIMGASTSFGCYYMNATNADGTAYVGPSVAEEKTYQIPADYLGIWTCDFAVLP